jgi:hypothetical protein
MGIDRRSVIFESSYVTKREQGTVAENLRDFNMLPHGENSPLTNYLARERQRAFQIACDHASQGR